MGGGPVFSIFRLALVVFVGICWVPLGLRFCLGWMRLVVGLADLMVVVVVFGGGGRKGMAPALLATGEVRMVKLGGVVEGLLLLLWL